MTRTVYLMRLWLDGTVSVVWNGTTVVGAQRFLRASRSCAYAGRHWLADTPVVTGLYWAAMDACHAVGLPWTDPRTGRTYQPGEKTKWLTTA